ncbi:Ig-like domain-containing protein [Neobacillus drentensis]|uniref:Ig-like domain-containing protein n=1 Tax=Neobacillus drentensis TaxID=220684 RepID=UPI00082664D9|nr:Ig-like domain-containing protein [Neobacillus drentensis]
MLEKRLKKVGMLFLVIFSFLYFTHANEAEAKSTSGNNVKSVSVKSGSSTIFMGGSTMAKTKLTLEKKSKMKASSIKISYSSSNSGIAKVDQKGEITGVSEGTVIITAKAERKIGKVKVKILPNVKSVKTVQTAPLMLGASSTVKAYISLDKYSKKKLSDIKVSYSSSNTKIATVDQYGRITGKSEGSVTISAKAEKREGKITIKVLPNVTKIALVKTEPLLIGESADLKATVSLDKNSKKKLTDFKVTYTSSNPKVATVNTAGKLTGVAAGPVTITAKAENKLAKITFSVESHITNLSISKQKDLLDIGEVLDTQTTITLNPNSKKQLSDIKISYSSSNPSVAAVNENGQITGVAEGTVTISAKALDKVATSTIKVSPLIWTLDAEELVEDDNNMTWASDSSKFSLNNYILNAKTSTVIKKYNGAVDFYSKGFGVLDYNPDHLSLYSNNFKLFNTVADMSASFSGTSFFYNKYQRRYTPDGSYLLYTTPNDYKYLVNLTTNELEKEFVGPYGHWGRLYSLDISPNADKTVISGGDEFYIFDLKTGVIEKTFYDEGVRNLSYNANGSEIATIKYNAADVKIWDVDSEDIKYILADHAGEVNDFSYSSDGRFFATSGDDGKIIVYDVRDNYRIVRTLITKYDQKQNRLGWSTNQVKTIAFNPAGKELAATYYTPFNDEPNLVLWNLNGLK